MGEGGIRRGAEGDADDKAAPLLALLAQQHSAMHHLWAVYVAATFAAAGFGASDQRDAIVAAVVTAGFWMFTLGHRALLSQTLAMIEAIRLDLKKLKRPGRLLPGAVEAGIAIRNPWRTASLIHWGIDGCVTAAILAPVLLRFAF